jgi:hypothetical protein
VEADDYDMMMTSALPEGLTHVSFTNFKRFSEDEMLIRSREYRDEMSKRRTLRFYSPEPVPFEVIKNIIQTAGEEIYSATIQIRNYTVYKVCSHAFQFHLRNRI